MPWCPNCKTEYREGVTHCADCKAELVNDFNEVLLYNATAMLVKVDAEHGPFTIKLKEFLDYSGISSVIRQEETEIGVYVTPEDFNKAKKLFKAFYSVEMEREAQRMQEIQEAGSQATAAYNDYFGDDEDDIEDDLNEKSAPLSSDGDNVPTACACKQAKEYVSAAARYEDYKSSGTTFTVLGVIGLIVGILSLADVITFFGSGYSSLVLVLIFGVFLVLGVVSYIKAGQLKQGAVDEKQLIAEVKEWMSQNITKEALAALNPEEEDSETAELLYLDCMDSLVNTILAAFPNVHASLAEQLIEELSEIYQSKETN
ncbi:MAG: DUF308 domain-containing protein [Lachnospiraceae bacterium]|nr:DUF308 domain-containing protein [Lachnospiraceae bacterium]